MDGTLFGLSSSVPTEFPHIHYTDTYFEKPGFKFRFVVRHHANGQDTLHFLERDKSDTHLLTGMSRAKRACQMEDNTSSEQEYLNGDILDLESARKRNDWNFAPWQKQLLAHDLRKAYLSKSIGIPGNHDIDFREGRYALINEKPGKQGIGGIEYREHHISFDRQGRRVARFHGDIFDRELMGKSQTFWYNLGSEVLVLLEPLENYLQEHFEDVSIVAFFKKALKFFIYRVLNARKSIITYLKENPDIDVFRSGHTHMADNGTIVIGSDDSAWGYVKEATIAVRNFFARPLGIAAIESNIKKRTVVVCNDGDCTGQVSFAPADFNSNVAVFWWKKTKMYGKDEDGNKCIILKECSAKRRKKLEKRGIFKKIFRQKSWVVITFDQLNFKPTFEPIKHKDKFTAYVDRLEPLLYRLAPPQKRQRAAKVVLIAHQLAFPAMADVRKGFLKLKSRQVPEAATRRQKIFRKIYRFRAILARKALRLVWQAPQRRRQQVRTDIRFLTQQLKAQAQLPGGSPHRDFTLPEPVAPKTMERFLMRISRKQERKWEREQAMRALATQICSRSTGHLPEHLAPRIRQKMALRELVLAA